ncbi:hypothetical protein K443DRAFT_16194 [Laccaria amethystina LaAM-08-1]|uniref:Unplaced genomic scaffold K443scaffold_1270, whole genome shotgun sequence n=1 Tax=Laccaria amethystina LaAM-08-1 TaxID=1095629 RepID=A0A0C9WPD7_9AGAR|nr:hypothetical protein K443DRAFT_16194 [Laccaria amethystina LaAM-08-1]
MNNLFLGIVGHHFRVVIGMKWDERDKEVETAFDNQVPREKDLKKGHQLLRAKGTTLKQLETLQIPALRELCILYNVHHTVRQQGHRRVKKRPFAIALSSVCNGASRPPSTSTVVLEGGCTLE